MTGALFTGIIAFNDYLKPKSIIAVSVFWPILILFMLGSAAFK